MDALFQKIIEGQELNTSEANKTRSMDMQLVRDIGHLQEMVDKDAPIDQAYAFLKTRLYPAVLREGVLVPTVFFTVATTVMDRILPAKKNDMWSESLPTVAEIFRVCSDIGVLKAADRFALVQELVVYLCHMDTSPSDYPSVEAYERHLATRDLAISDLVESWKVLTLPKSIAGTPGKQDGSIPEDFWFPNPDKYTIAKLARSKDFTLAVKSLFPQYMQNPLHHPPVLAVATLALLLDTTRSTASVRQKASRFVTKVGHMMAMAGIDGNQLRKATVAAVPSIEGYILAQWPRIEAYLSELSKGNGRRTHESTSTSSRNYPDGSLEARLNSAYLNRNLREVKKLCGEFMALPNDASRTRRLAELQRQPHVFNMFIKVFMALNSPDNAIEVWNFLIQVGLKPSLMTWNDMLVGCKEARNVSALRLVWQRLVASRTQLDVAIWTTRISGLMNCEDPRGAIEALEEMARLWDQAKLQGNAHAVEPTIQPVNAALQGLIRLNNIGATKQLLSWARGQGIRPDTFTFNLLLRPAVLSGHSDEVDAIFKSMKALGVEADAATFTIILDATLANLQEEPEKQEEFVADIFHTMEKVGLNINHQTYGKIIYHLLRSGDHAQACIKYVLEHLFKQGLELSPHIYTMLVEHYFSRHDLDAVDSLLQRHRILDFDDMDRIFYDRLIKGYALVGEVDTAFSIYQKLSTAGVHVNLGSLYEVLIALIDAARLEDAKTLVHDTTKKFMEQYGEPGWRGHSFWHVAVQQGFVDWIPTEEGGRATPREAAW